MEFEARERKDTTDLNPRFDIAQVSKSLYANHWIARPVALKSNSRGSTDVWPEVEGKHAHWERPPISELQLSKKRCIWAPGTAPSQNALTGNAVPGWDLAHKAAATESGISTERPHDQPGSSLFKSLRTHTEGATASSLLQRSGLQRRAPPASNDEKSQSAPTASQVGATHAQPSSEKRSAFREVAKGHKMAGCKQQRAGVAQPRLRGKEAKEKLKRKSPEQCLANKCEVYGPLVSAQPFNGSPQTLLPMHTNNLYSHHYHGGTEIKEAFQTPSFIPLTRQPQTDFLNSDGVKSTTLHDVESQVRRSNRNSYKEVFAMRFGTLQNVATAKHAPSLSFPWQQSLVPTSVLPLSPSVPRPQCENWCAKCNASFRMTSDLVYHMRTQHKRSADVNSATSSSAANSFGGKRAEEKLRCECCGETFRERHHLTRHMTSHNTDRE